MINKPQRAISIRSVDVPPIGTLGWASKAGGFYDFGSAAYSAYLFQPDGEEIEYYYAVDDLQFVPEDFEPNLALKAEIEKLAQQRMSLDRAEDAYSNLKRELDFELKPYLTARNAARDEEQYQYEQVAFYARVAYLATGEKQPDQDVEIRRDVQVRYNPAAALKWAIDAGFLSLLTLDTKAFERAVKDGKVPSEVATLHDNWKPYVSSNLEHRLPDSSDAK